MNKLTIAMLSAALLMTGCVPPRLAKPGGSESDFNADKARCEYEAASSVQAPIYGSRTMFGDAFDISSRRSELAVMCMKAKGWQEVRR